MLEKLLKEINELQDAKTLLVKIYLAVGPHGERPIPTELQQELNSYFKFDDSK